MRSTSVEAWLRGQGYRDGAPPFLAPSVVAGDRLDYMHQPCQRCGHHFLEVKPMHDGKTYRLLCVCPRCGADGEA